MDRRKETIGAVGGAENSKRYGSSDKELASAHAKDVSREPSTRLGNIRARVETIAELVGSVSV
ncbi:hypothetical protein J2X72_004336 [Phyllobacterium sp. 1468]|nr:hypothetical protein [Phyllobacterium sp. 1468]